MTTLKPRAIALLATLQLTLTPACGGTEEEPGGEGGPAADGFVLQASEASNYTFESALMISEIAVAPATELTFDWSEVTIDYALHELDPQADIDMLAVIVWKLSAAELAVKLNADDLSQSDFEAIAMLYTENAVTSGRLFDFTEFGHEIDDSLLLEYLDPELFDPATHAYTAMAMTGTTPGKGTRMIQAFRMDPSSTNTHVELHLESATLDYEVDMSSLQRVAVPAGDPNITVDWSGITQNAIGGDFDPTAITEVAVGKYAMSVAELEARFLDLDLIAEELYWGEVQSGSSYSLAATATEAGAGFAGVDDTGTWLVGLRCGSCTNPAPWYLTVLELD